MKGYRHELWVLFIPDSLGLLNSFSSWSPTTNHHIHALAE